MKNNNDTVPSISKTAFYCSHCNVLTSQSWFGLTATSYDYQTRIPKVFSVNDRNKILNDSQLAADEKNAIIELIDKNLLAKPYVCLPSKKSGFRTEKPLSNINISQCYNCKEFSVWVHTQMVWPRKKVEIQPNQDLPVHIKSLFEEARGIVSASPKGAAALLRLSIQYLCKELGEDGENIDRNIASLVVKGLNPLVQKSLDIVRVIGNEAVHPGEINLDDNKDIALKLFDLVNLIADEMISRPKQVQDLYDSLPENKLQGIEARNKKATKLENKS